MPEPYYQRDGITVYHGDCRVLAEQISPQSIDVLLMDPPFFLPARVATSRREWPRSLGDLGVMSGYFRDTFAQFAPLIKGTGGLYTFSDGVSYAVLLAILYPLFDRTQCIVWDKVKGGLGHGWRHSTELLIHAAFTDTVYTPGFRRDVVSVPPVPSDARAHPSEKPVGLLGQLLAAHPRGLVFDPFMGSGPILDAARHHGWRVIACELEERLCEVAVRRLEQAILPAAVPTDVPVALPFDLDAS